MKKTLFVIGIILLINLITLVLYGIDKRKAKKGNWRIPEKVLLAWSSLGPWGGFAGIKLFHHKTNKKKFTITVPLFMAVHIVICATLIYLNMQ